MPPVVGLSPLPVSARETPDYPWPDRHQGIIAVGELGVFEECREAAVQDVEDLPSRPWKTAPSAL